MATIERTVMDCKELVKPRYYLQIKDKGYNLIKNNKNIIDFPDIYIPVGDNQHSIYSANGFLLYNSKHKNEIDLVNMLIEKMYNNNKTLMKIYNYYNDNRYYIFCIYIELIDKILTENHLIEFKKSNEIYLSISHKFKHPHEWQLTDCLIEEDNIKNYIKL